MKNLPWHFKVNACAKKRKTGIITGLHHYSRAASCQLKHLLVGSLSHRFKTRFDHDINFTAQGWVNLLVSLSVMNWLEHRGVIPTAAAPGAEPGAAPLTGYNERRLLSTLLVLKGGRGSKLAEEAVFWQLIPPEWGEYWWAGFKGSSGLTICSRVQTEVTAGSHSSRLTADHRYFIWTPLGLDCLCD